jgi:carbon-monoxide dehydrogenase medium subunit
VAPTVLRCQKAEELLEKASLPLSEAIINQAAELAVETARPISDVRSTQSYRKKMAGVLLKRAIVSILNNQ